MFLSRNLIKIKLNLSLSLFFVVMSSFSFSQSLFTPPTNNILDPEEAFVMEARVTQANELTIFWNIEEGYYLYKDKFFFSSANQIQLGNPSFSPSILNYDEFFGNVEVYYNYSEIKIPFSRVTPEEFIASFQINYQGCKKDSICYPPIEKNIDLIIPSTYSFDTPLYERPIISEQDRLKQMIVNSPIWIVLLTFYGFGLLLSLTPCVLPLIPIVSGIIIGQKKNVSTFEAFYLSSTYVMGMCFTYTIGGAIAATLGYQLQAAFQEPWIIITFSLGFLMLALSMFDFFEITLPNKLNLYINNVVNNQKKGTLFGTFLIGALSALIVTTCIAPPLVATLAVISQNGDVIKGSTSLFFLSLGMGTPLIIIGTSAGKLLPKSSYWMAYIKKCFGFLILALAIWMLERIMSDNLTTMLWSILIFSIGIFLTKIHINKKRFSSYSGLFLGVAVCLYSLSVIANLLLSSQRPFLPSELIWNKRIDTPQENELDFYSIKNIEQLEENIKNAITIDKPVMLELTADWCVTCKEIERYTFSNEEIIKKSQEVMLLQIDITDNTDSDRELLKYLNSFGPPTILFYNKNGEEAGDLRTVGFISKDQLMHRLNYLTET